MDEKSLKEIFGSKLILAKFKYQYTCTSKLFEDKKNLIFVNATIWLIPDHASRPPQYFGCIALENQNFVSTCPPKSKKRNGKI